MSVYSIMIAEDDPLQRRTLRRILEEDFKAQVIETADGADALQKLKHEAAPSVKLALIDLQMPVMDGMALLRQIRNFMPKLPCIILTGSEDVQDVVEAMRLGAVDFITKPAQRERLVTSVRNALAIHNLQTEVKRLQSNRSPYYSFADIQETSPGLSKLLELGRKAASSDIPVLITGESGVGKEILANAIHHESKRADKSFVPINCGALPDNLVESTLFGHEKGSFTGAVARTIGKCREADGGTLFLDEVGELKLDTQVKLLRMLQQGEIEPVGSGKPLKVDVRIISATNRPLEKLIAQGRFREDLYYRLQGLPLHIPSLRERRRDIEPLARYLLERISVSENRLGVELSDEARAWLASYSWPGNVRELQHVLMRAVLLAEGSVIEAGNLLRWAKQEEGETLEKTTSVFPSSIMLDGPDGQPKSLEKIEQEVIEATLARFGAHIGKAAAALNVGQSTLYKRMRKRTG